jgi:hypothetical protein
MKRILLVGLVLVALLAAFSAPALASRPAHVEGTIEYVAHFKVYDDSGECVPPAGPTDTRLPCMKLADGNMFVETVEEAIWLGDVINGTSTDDCVVVVHSSGAWFYKAIASFEGTVDDREGTLQMSMVGSKPSGEGAEWRGSWVILSGGGDLATLHGRGTWWGAGASGPEVWGSIANQGQIHFDPE